MTVLPHRPSESHYEELERNILEIIARMERDYRAAIKPYVAELVKIRSMSTRSLVMLNEEYVQRMRDPTC